MSSVSDTGLPTPWGSLDILIAKGIMPSAPKAAPRQGGASRVKQEEIVVLEDSDSDDVDAELSQLKVCTGRISHSRPSR